MIDADRLKSYIDCGHLRPPTEVCFSELDVCNMIDKAPTVSAEAVEVVRCKECKHHHTSEMYGYCDLIAVKGRRQRVMKYCSLGERR